LRCILSAYFPNIAQLQPDGSYLNIRSKERLVLHPTSILTTVYPEWVVYHELVKSSAYYIHNASKIEFEWVFELSNNYYKDMRKEQAANKFAGERPVEDFRPKGKEEGKEGLVRVGGQKAKPELFKTSVLGLKDMKKNKLSFQEDFDF
jgi:HrpA-like RNA helicase